MARKENQNPKFEQKPGKEQRDRRSKKKRRTKKRDKRFEDFAAFEASFNQRKKERTREAIPESESSNTKQATAEVSQEENTRYREDMNANQFAELADVQGRPKEVIEAEIVEDYPAAAFKDKRNIVDAEIVSERILREEATPKEISEIVPDISEVREKLNEHEKGTTHSIEAFISVLEKEDVPVMEKAAEDIRTVRDLFSRVTEISVDISALHNQPNTPEKDALLASLTFEQERAVAAAMGIQSAFEQLRNKGVEEYRQKLRNETSAIPETLETGIEVTSEIEKVASEVREQDPESADDYLTIIKNSKEKTQAITTSFETTYTEKAQLLDEEARKLTPHIHGIEKAQAIIRDSDIPGDEKQQLRQTYEAVKASMYDQIAYLTRKSEKIRDGGLFEELTAADIVEDDPIEVADDMIISSEDIIDNAIAEALADELGLSEEEIAERMHDEENQLLLDARDFYGEVAELEDIIANLIKDIEHLRAFKEFAKGNALSEEIPEKFQDVHERINGFANYKSKFEKLKEYADSFALVDDSNFPEEQHEDLGYFREELENLANEAQEMIELSEKLAKEIKDMNIDEMNDYLDMLSDSYVGFSDASFNAGTGTSKSKKAPNIGTPSRKKPSLMSRGFDLYFKLLGLDTSKSIF